MILRRYAYTLISIILLSAACSGAPTPNSGSTEVLVPFADANAPASDGETPQVGGRPGELAPFPILPPLPTSDDGRPPDVLFKVQFSCARDYSLCSRDATESNFTAFLAGQLSFEELAFERFWDFCLWTRNLEAYTEVALWHLQAQGASITQCQTVEDWHTTPGTYRQCEVVSANPNFCEEIGKTTAPDAPPNPVDELMADFTVAGSSVNEPILFTALGAAPVEASHGLYRFHWTFDDGTEAIGTSVVERSYWAVGLYFTRLEIEAYDDLLHTWEPTYPRKIFVVATELH